MEGDFQTGSNASTPAECPAIHLSSDTVCLEILSDSKGCGFHSLTVSPIPPPQMLVESPGYHLCS